MRALVIRTAHPSPAHDEELLRLARAARWIVPLVAAAEGGASASLSVVTLAAPDGRRALPVFSGVEALAAWDRSARPVPVTAARAARAALAQGCEVLAVDIAAGHATELRPSMVWALAHGQPWRPAHHDPVVAGSMARALGPEADVVRHRLQDGEPAGSGVLRVVLGLVPGLGRQDVEALTTRVAGRLAGDEELRVRVDGLAFRLAPAARRGSRGQRALPLP